MQNESLHRSVILSAMHLNWNTPQFGSKVSFYIAMVTFEVSTVASFFINFVLLCQSLNNSPGRKMFTEK